MVSRGDSGTAVGSVGLPGIGGEGAVAIMLVSTIAAAMVGKDLLAVVILGVLSAVNHIELMLNAGIAPMTGMGGCLRCRA
jgi:hypothetical protein